MPKRVDEADPPAQPRLEQERGDLGQLAVVAADAVVVRAPVDDVDGLRRAVGQPHAQPVAVALEVGEGHEQRAEPLRGLACS